MSASIPAIAAFALLSAQAATAQPAQPQLADFVEAGVTVSIVDDRGAEFDGRVESVSNQAVRLAMKKGTREIPLEQIVRIERPDGIKNGALAGLGVGMTLGGLSGVVAAAGSGSRNTGFVVASILSNGLVCAGIGALIDAASDGRQTLYERGRHKQTRVTPIVDRGTRALAISLSW